MSIEPNTPQVDTWPWWDRQLHYWGWKLHAVLRWFDWRRKRILRWDDWAYALANWMEARHVCCPRHRRARGGES